MKKRTLLILTPMLLAGGVALGLLRIYEVDLIQMIVVNAVLQKAPAGFPGERIRSEFDQALREAKTAGSEAAYLTELLDLSRRLEKVQELSWEQVEDILTKLAEKTKAFATAGRRRGSLEPVLPWAGEVRAVSDRNRSGEVSKLRAYHSIGFCDPFPASFPSDAASGADSFFGYHFFDGCGRSEPGGLEAGTSSQAPETRPGQGDHSQGR